MLAAFGFGLVALAGCSSHKQAATSGTTGTVAVPVSRTVMVGSAPLLKDAPSIPKGKKLAWLEKLGLRAARANEDDNPTRIQVIPTTARALGLYGRHRPIYLVVVYGRFVCQYCSPPPAAPLPTGTVAAIYVDAKKRTVFGGTLGKQGVTPGGLGPVITIYYRW
jgi:hypothetical protein